MASRNAGGLTPNSWNRVSCDGSTSPSLRRPERMSSRNRDATMSATRGCRIRCGTVRVMSCRLLLFAQAAHRLLLLFAQAAHRLLPLFAQAAHRRLLLFAQAAHRRLLLFAPAAHRRLLLFRPAAHRRLLLFRPAA